MATTVRILTGADAEPFRALRLRALREHATAFTSSHDDEARKPLAATQARLTDPANTFWGAFADGRLLGIVGLAREARTKAAHSADVVAMYVAPEAGRQGLGRALLQALVDHARADAGLEQLVLTVTRGNDAARDLYLSAGFVTFGIESRAIRVDGRYYDKEHMILFLRTPSRENP